MILLSSLILPIFIYALGTELPPFVYQLGITQLTLVINPFISF